MSSSPTAKTSSFPTAAVIVIALMVIANCGCAAVYLWRTGRCTFVTKWIFDHTTAIEMEGIFQLEGAVRDPYGRERIPTRSTISVNSRPSVLVGEGEGAETKQKQLATGDDIDIVFEDMYNSDDDDENVVPVGMTTAPPPRMVTTYRPSVTDQSPPTILQRAADFGKIWKMKEIPIIPAEQIMEEFIFYADRLDVIMDGDCAEYKCDDPDCEWNGEAMNGILFPHQVIHGMIYHDDGMALSIVV